MCIFNGKYVLQCVDFDDEFAKFPGGYPRIPKWEGRPSPDPSSAALCAALGAFGPGPLLRPIDPPTSTPGYALVQVPACESLILEIVIRRLGN